MTPTRILVTGANSFTARHLIPMLEADSRVGEVVGSDLQATGPSGLAYRPADLTDPRSARDLVEATSPGHILHLAGTAARDADLCFRVNLDATRHTLEAAAGLSRPPGVLLVSSAAVYGLTRPEESPVEENTPLRPAGAYGASKAAAEMAALSLHRQGRLTVTVARPFNLVGPGLPPGFAPSDFMQQIKGLRDAGKGGGSIQVGNLEPRRDFVDIRDAVLAYRELLLREELGGRIFNVASGAAVAIQEVLDRIIRVIGVQVTVETDPDRVKKVDVLEQAGSYRALETATGWAPGVPLQKSLEDMLAAMA